MDSTILNNANVYAVNSNEIFQYSPKRKIEILNNDNKLSPYDKSFTYLITCHPISPYSQDQTNSYFLSPYDIKCPDDILINNKDYHYLNNDAFDQWSDSTESFYPILSYDTTCKYDNNSLSSADFFEIFSLFIYKNKIHQVINDSTSYPALVHCSIDLPDINKQYHKYYHIILTRNDNIYTMHLILDRFGLFSTYDPEYIFRLSNERNNTSISEIPSDVTNIENATIDNTAFVNLDEEYTIDLTYTNNQRYIEFIIENESDIIIEILPDERHKATGCSVTLHQSVELGTNYGGLALSDSAQQSVLNPDTIISQNDTVINSSSEDGRFVVYNNLQPGKYRFLISIDIQNDNYPDVAFQSYDYQNTNTNYETFYNKPINVSFKIQTGNNYNKLNFDQDNNYKTDTIILDYNINISEIINDSKITLGYFERYPDNILNNNKLFKNSFKGYITEFSFYRDQSYLRKFNNIVPFNSFQYITDYTASYNENLLQSVYIRPDLVNINNNPTTASPFESQNNMKAVIKNDNKLPIKSYFNLLQNNDNFTEYNMNYSSQNQYVDEDEMAMPRKEYLTNFTIDDIILINENIIDTDILNNASNKITHIEYPKDIDSSSIIEYTGNNININNKTFCIFIFDIMQNLITSDGYTVFDQKKFLLKGNYELEEYNENKTYQEYFDSDFTNNYIQPKDLDINSLKKNSILNSLNNYINNIKNSINDLYIVKFFVQCFRDARYMFIYKISSKAIETDSQSYYEYQLDSEVVTSGDLFNDVYNDVISPYYSNFDHRIPSYNGSISSYYYIRKPGNQTGFTGKQQLYNGFYYSNEKQEGTKTIPLLWSNYIYDEDFIPIHLDQIYKITTPDYLSTPQDDIYLDNLIYDEIHIRDLNGTIYFIMKVSDYLSKYGNLLSKYIERELQNDATVITPITQNINNHYYIELYHTSTDDYVTVGNYCITQGLQKTRIPNYNITELDSTSYKIDYTNIDSDDINLFIGLDFSPNLSDNDKFKQALSVYEFSHEQALESNYINTLPTIKNIDKKSFFQLKYEELFNDYQAMQQYIPMLSNKIYGRYNTIYNSYIQDLVYHTNYEIGVDSIGSYENIYNEYLMTYQYESYDSYFSRINITYENDKRIITDKD